MTTAQHHPDHLELIKLNSGSGPTPRLSVALPIQPIHVFIPFKDNPPCLRHNHRSRSESRGSRSESSTPAESGLTLLTEQRCSRTRSAQNNNTDRTAGSEAEPAELLSGCTELTWIRTWPSRTKQLQHFLPCSINRMPSAPSTAQYTGFFMFPVHQPAGL